jgi:FemAB-related protein (PEP-CTERM system-associated)
MMNSPEKVMKAPVNGSNKDNASGDNTIHIDSYSENKRSAWNNFVLNCDQSTFFHLIEWKELIEKNFGHKSHYIMAFQNDKVSGILPLFEIKNILFGHSLISMPCVVYGGVCAGDGETENALYRSAATLGRLMGVDYVEMRNRFSCLSDTNYSMTDRVDSSYENNSGDWITKDLYVTFEKEIYPDNESNLKAIPRKQRRMIRQGIKAGLESKIGGKEFMEGFYDLYARNLKNHGTPVFSCNFFKGIMDTFPDTFILSVWKGNVMVAAVMTFVFKDRVIPSYPVLQRSVEGIPPVRSK